MDTIKELLGLLKSKMVWGGIILGCAQLATFADYRAQLMAIGIGLLGAGAAHKLDKIKDAANAPTGE